MFLGVDIGTSGVKAVVIDRAGNLVAQSQSPLSVQRPAPLWSEQDPESWWQATDAAVRALPAQTRRAVRAVGLAGQMHGATLLDAADQPLRPAILWNDGRSFAECAELENSVPALRLITGNIAMPGFTAPKLLWLRRHESELFNRVRTVLLPKDYVRLRMTGEKISDLSDAAGTLWLDVARRDWSDPILSACGLSRTHMPRLVEGSSEAGKLRAEIARAWGMDQVPLAGGGSDNAAGAAGVGVVSAGDALLSLGTSGVIFVATDGFKSNPGRAVHSFCHCLPGLWHQMSVHLSAASCLDWAARLLGVAGAAEMLQLAEQGGIAQGPELFLPYLSGERTPHNDPQVRGAFLRLDYDSTPQRLAAAALEGVAFALSDGLAALRSAGTEVEKLAVIGGGARSSHWGRIIASSLNVPLLYLRGGDVGPALGAARLAQLMIDGGAPRDVCARPPVAFEILPEPALADQLAAKAAAFRAAYSGITPKRDLT